MRLTEMFDNIKSISEKDKKTPEQTVLKIMEECGEIAEAVLSYEKAPACEYKGKSLDDIVEECSDVLILVYSLVSDKYNIPHEVIEETVKKKLVKWESKLN